MKNYLNKIRAVTLICPFCGKPFQTRIMGKARVECPACKTDLIVSTKMKINVLITIIGFALVIGLLEILGISDKALYIKFPVMVVGVVIVAFVITKICVLFLKPNKVYTVDFEDPTIINRKK